MSGRVGRPKAKAWLNFELSCDDFIVLVLQARTKIEHENEERYRRFAFRLPAGRGSRPRAAGRIFRASDVAYEVLSDAVACSFSRITGLESEANQLGLGAKKGSL